MTPRDKRTAIVGIVVVSLLFGLTRGVPAMMNWQRRHVAEATDATVRVAAARATRASTQLLRDSLTVRRGRLAAIDSVLLTGASASAAAADLASLLDSLASDAQFKVTAMQLRSDSVALNSLTQVSVRVTGIADVTGLAALLRAIESDDMPLVVRELSVAQPEPSAPDTKIEALRVDLVVETIARVTSNGRS